MIVFAHVAPGALRLRWSGTKAQANTGHQEYLNFLHKEYLFRQHRQRNSYLFHRWPHIKNELDMAVDSLDATCRAAGSILGYSNSPSSDGKERA